jgi:hypothetical protein
MRVLAAASAILASGCIITQTSSTVVVRDGAEVTLAGAEGQLPPGREHADVVVQHGAFATESGARAHYTLHAVRSEDGSISFEWETHVPLLNGEDQLVLPASGSVEIADESVLRPEMLAQPTLKLQSCASLMPKHARTAFVGWRATEWEGCGRSLAVPFTVETPWSNVVSARQTVRPMRGVALGSIIVSTLVFGGLGGLFLALHCTNRVTGEDCSGPLHSVGWVFVGTGALIDLLLLPTLVAPERDTVTYGVR